MFFFTLTFLVWGKVLRDFAEFLKYDKKGNSYKECKQIRIERRFNIPLKLVYYTRVV